MERVFELPDLGEGLEDAVVSQWLVGEGDTVELNQPIAEIETAKAVVEMPSPYAGRVARLHAAAGDTVRVGAALVTFVVEGDSAGVAGPSTAGVAATPAVRRLAKERGVELSRIEGTGPEGRVTRADVEAAADDGTSPAGEGETVTTWTASVDTDAEEVPVSPMRAAIAGRLAEVAAIPQVTTFRTVDCTALEAFRKDMGVSPLPVFVRALAEICEAHPMTNASWADDRILVHRKVNVGVAVDTERGLVVPVVTDTRALGIGNIAREIERLARAAREGALRPADVAGATIAVSNTGSYGSESGTPLLNPGHAVTVSMGVIAPKALVVEGRVEARAACILSVTFDHRVLDGATVGRAVGELVELLGSPERLETLPR